MCSQYFNENRFLLLQRVDLGLESPDTYWPIAPEKGSSCPWQCSFGWCWNIPTLGTVLGAEGSDAALLVALGLAGGGQGVTEWMAAGAERC